MVVVHCVLAVLKLIEYYEHDKEEVNPGEPVFGGVLKGRRFFVTSVEVASTVGLVLPCSMSKNMYLIILLGVPNSHLKVLGILRW